MNRAGAGARRPAGRWPRRLLPQKVRARLALSYAVLFLGAGAVLLAVTYALVAASLPDRPGVKLTEKVSLEEAKVQRACKAAPGTVPLNECRKAFLAGQQAEATSQRDATLQRLLVYSLAGLGLMTVASACCPARNAFRHSFSGTVLGCALQARWILASSRDTFSEIFSRGRSGRLAATSA